MNERGMDNIGIALFTAAIYVLVLWLIISALHGNPFWFDHHLTEFLVTFGWANAAGIWSGRRGAQREANDA